MIALEVDDSGIAGLLSYFPAKNIYVDIVIGRYVPYSQTRYISRDKLKAVLKEIDNIIRKRKELAEQLGLYITQLSVKAYVDDNPQYVADIILDSGNNKYLYLNYMKYSGLGETLLRVVEVKYRHLRKSVYRVEKKTIKTTTDSMLKEEDVVSSKIRYNEKRVYTTILHVFEEKICQLLDLNPAYILMYRGFDDTWFQFFDGRKRLTVLYELFPLGKPSLEIGLEDVNSRIYIVDDHLPYYRNEDRGEFIQYLKEIISWLRRRLDPKATIKYRIETIIAIERQKIRLLFHPISRITDYPLDIAYKEGETSIISVSTSLVKDFLSMADYIIDMLSIKKLSENNVEVSLRLNDVGIVFLDLIKDGVPISTVLTKYANFKKNIVSKLIEKIIERERPLYATEYVIYKL